MGCVAGAAGHQPLIWSTVLNLTFNAVLLSQTLRSKSPLLSGFTNAAHAATTAAAATFYTRPLLRTRHAADHPPCKSGATEFTLTG